MSKEDRFFKIFLQCLLKNIFYNAFYEQKNMIMFQIINLFKLNYCRHKNEKIVTPNRIGAK